MNLSKRWLHDYVNLDVSDQQFADDMTLSGSKVESFETEGADIKNVIVGKVVSLVKHPDSDHLWICQIDVGAKDNIQIVTGAQNLKVNDVVPVAMDDSFVSGGHHIKKGKLRGVESNGMLCSLGELGLTIHDFPYAIEDGIFVLGDDCDKTLGKDIHEAIGLDDVITEFEITSNRADCLSITGLAREAAATFDSKLVIPEPEVKKTHGDVNGFLSVEIKEPSLCYRYAGAVVENVRVKPSPRWMRERLRACGVRPINNIVDITNFVMLEYGQPMHAFDLRYLDGHKVIVRKALDGEKITTLDGVERALKPEMLVIADENKPVAVAGVMGGEYSGIMDDTTTIVFESAMFNGVSVRRTAKALGMRTEASARYEKELDATGCLRSLKRALQLVEELDAGDIVGGVVDCDHSDKIPVTLPFEPEWVNNFIGIDVSAEEQKKILEKIDFKVENGIAKATTSKSDPALKIKGEMPEINAEDVIAIRVTAKSNVDSTMEIFYTTSSSPNLEQSKSFNTKVTKSDDFKEYVINTAGKATWKDTVNFFRFDIISTAGEFEVSKIELLGYDESQLPITITIDKKEYASPFHPILKNDELYVPASSYHGFFSLNNLYYEWSRYTGKLRIVTKKDHEIIFNIDSDVALVDGKETKLAEKVTLRDGLPVLPLFFIYKIEGINYTFENKAVTVSTLDKKYQEKPYSSLEADTL